MPRKKKGKPEAESTAEAANAAPARRRAVKKPALEEVAPSARQATVQTPDPQVRALSIQSPLQEGVSYRERIALLAYSYWEARGYQGGSPEEDWYRAEREVSSQGEQQ
jgi:hypothetical protein